MNLSYQSAKELKDAGFPQAPYGEASGLFGDERHSEYILWKEEACSPVVTAGTEDYQNGIERGDNLVKVPTLSELIEACGKRFAALELNWDKTTYVATGQPSTGFNHFGDTPEEAVKELWLALRPLQSKDNVAEHDN